MDKNVYKHMMDKAVPSAALIQKTKNKMKKENPIMIKKSIIAFAACMLLLTTTVFAALYFLTPSEIAHEFGHYSLAEAFESEDAININASQISGDYRFTLMSIVSGDTLTNTQFTRFFDGEARVSRDRTYVITAIQRLDGSPISAEEGLSFVISPFVRGFEPLHILSALGSVGNIATIDGIMYVLTSTDEISMFAGHGVYIGIYSIPRTFVEPAFILNEDTGAITPNPAFDGISILFDLPLDVSLADPVRVQQFIDETSWILDQITESNNAATESDSMPSLMDFPNADSLNLADLTLIPESVHILVPYDDVHSQWGDWDMYVWSGEVRRTANQADIFVARQTLENNNEFRIGLDVRGDDVVLSLVRLNDNGDLVGMMYLVPANMAR